MKYFPSGKSICYISIICTLLSTNILSISNAKFHDWMHGLLSYIPYENLLSQSKSKNYKSLSAENKHLRQNNEKFAKAEKVRNKNLKEARTITKRITSRTVRNVGVNVSSVAFEAVPYAGIAAIVAVTTADVYDGCQTMKDTNELLGFLEGAPDKAGVRRVCGMSIPTAEEIESSIDDIQDAIGGTIYEMIN